MACVYKHTNKINGKCYIGIVLGNRNPKRRWGNGSQYINNKQKKFANAIKKYGWNGFSHEILFANLSDEEAKKKEKELIKKYDSFVHGYNATLGGDGTTGRKLSKEEKEKLRKLHLGIKPSLESRLKMSKSQKEFRSNLTQEERNNIFGQKGNKNGMYDVHRFGKLNPFYGKKHTEETKNKISKANKGKICSFRKAVNQYDLNGNFINSYNSISEAAIKNNVKNSGHICQCCHNQRKYAYGYIWRFKQC